MTKSEQRQKTSLIGWIIWSMILLDMSCIRRGPRPTSTYSRDILRTLRIYDDVCDLHAAKFLQTFRQGS